MTVWSYGFYDYLDGLYVWFTIFNFQLLEVDINTYNICIYIYIYVYICVCVYIAIFVVDDYFISCKPTINK